MRRWALLSGFPSQALGRSRSARCWRFRGYQPTDIILPRCRSGRLPVDLIVEAEAGRDSLELVTQNREKDMTARKDIGNLRALEENTEASKKRPMMTYVLWTVQVLLALLFLFSGGAKLAL